MLPLIDKHNGRLVKRIGDGVMPAGKDWLGRPTGEQPAPCKPCE